MLTRWTKTISVGLKHQSLDRETQVKTLNALCALLANRTADEEHIPFYVSSSVKTLQKRDLRRIDPVLSTIHEPHVIGRKQAVVFYLSRF